MDDSFLSKKEKQSNSFKKVKSRKSFSTAPKLKCPLDDIIQVVGNGTNNNIININISTNQQSNIIIKKNKRNKSVYVKKKKFADETENKRKESPVKTKRKTSIEKINKKEERKSPIIQKKIRKENCASPSKHGKRHKKQEKNNSNQNIFCSTRKSSKISDIIARLQNFANNETKSSSTKIKNFGKLNFQTPINENNNNLESTNTRRYSVAPKILQALQKFSNKKEDNQKIRTKQKSQINKRKKNLMNDDINNNNEQNFDDQEGTDDLYTDSGEEDEEWEDDEEENEEIEEGNENEKNDDEVKIIRREKKSKSMVSYKPKKLKKGKISNIKTQNKIEEKSSENEDNSHNTKEKIEIVKFENDEDEESYNNKKISNLKKANKTNCTNNNENNFNNIKKININDEKQRKILKKNLIATKEKDYCFYGKRKKNLKNFNNKFKQSISGNGEGGIKISNSGYSQENDNSNDFESSNDNKNSSSVNNNNHSDTTSDNELILILNEEDKEKFENKSNLINNKINNDNEDYNQQGTMIKKRFVKNLDYLNIRVKTYVIQNFKSKDKKTNKDVYIPCKQTNFSLYKCSNDENNSEYIDTEKIDIKPNQLFKTEQNKVLGESYYSNLNTEKNRKNDNYDYDYRNTNNSPKLYSSNDTEEIENKKINIENSAFKSDFHIDDKKNNLGENKTKKKVSFMNKPIRIIKSKSAEDVIDKNANFCFNLSNNKQNFSKEKEIIKENIESNENSKNNEIENKKNNENNENNETIKNIGYEKKIENDDIDDIIKCENGERYILFKYANNLQNYYRKKNFLLVISHEVSLQLKPIIKNNLEKNESKYEKNFNKKNKKKEMYFSLDKKGYKDKIYKNTFLSDKLVKIFVKSNKIKKINKKEKEENKKIELELQKQKIREIQKKREIEKERERALESQRKKEREETLRQKENEKLKSAQNLIKIYNEKYLDFEDKKENRDINIIKNDNLTKKNNHWPSALDLYEKLSSNLINNNNNNIKSIQKYSANISLNRELKKAYFSRENKKTSKTICKVKGQKAKIRKFIMRNDEVDPYEKNHGNKSMITLHTKGKNAIIKKFISLENDNNYNLRSKSSKSKVKLEHRNNSSKESIKAVCTTKKKVPSCDKKENIAQKKLNYKIHASKSACDIFPKDNNYDDSIKKILIVNKKIKNASKKNKKYMSQNSSGSTIFGDLKNTKEDFKRKLIKATSKNLNGEMKFYYGPVDIGCVSAKNYNESIEDLNNKLKNFGYRCIKHVNHFFTYTNDYNIIYVEIVKIGKNLLYYLMNKKKIILYKNRRI